MLVEGWTGPVPTFINAIRRRNPFAIVLFICLDTFPTPHRAFRLDVDGYLTNSLWMSKEVLPAFAPTRVMQLAVDVNRIHRTAGQSQYRCVLIVSRLRAQRFP